MVITTYTSPASALDRQGQLVEAHKALSRCLSVSPVLCGEQAMRAQSGLRGEAVFQQYLEGLLKAD